MTLQPISKEQQSIVDAVGDGYNLQVDAVAGSGKTTTSLYLAKSFPQKNILLLTYNAKLKMETRQKATTLHLNHLEIHSYHAFCVKYFERTGYTDAGILRFLERIPPKCDSTIEERFPYNIIIIDEAQDMNRIYFRLVLRILEACASPPQLVVMGDRKQSIYAFNKADARYLTKCADIFPSPHAWKHGQLSISYRLTKPMASFLNECCDVPIVSIKEGDRVSYIICSTYGTKPFEQIERFLGMGYTYNDIFVLAATVKSNQSPVRILANRLSARQIPIYVPTHDEQKLDETVLHNKIVFSTFHQVKGLERPIVLVFDFSANYFRYYAKQEDPFQIPNTLYVAATRAQQHLVLFHDDGSAYCPFLHQQELFRSCRIQRSRKTLPENLKKNAVEMETSSSVLKEYMVQDLVRYLPVEIIQECLKTLQIEKQPPTLKTKKLHFTFTSTQENGLCESVGEITSVAIPSYFEYLSTTQMTISTHLNAKVKKKKQQGDIRQFLLKKKTAVSTCDISTMNTQQYIECLLKLSTDWVVLKSGYHFKKAQISRYDWITEDQLNEAVSRLRGRVADISHLLFEKEMRYPLNQCVIAGFCPMYHKMRHELWIVKIVSEVTPEHFVQSAIFHWMGERLHRRPMFTRLYNILDDGLYHINIPSLENFEHVLSKIIDIRQNGLESKNDDEFLKSCRNG